MNKKDNLYAKLAVYKQILEDCLRRLQGIEGDPVSSPKDKLSEIKKIKEELNKIGEQIDIIKKEIMLISTYNIN